MRIPFGGQRHSNWTKILIPGQASCISAGRRRSGSGDLHAAEVFEGFDEWVDAAGGTVPDAHAESGFDKVAGYALSHDAKADEADAFVQAVGPPIVEAAKRMFADSL